MASSFKDRVNEAWNESPWIVEELFDHGMCFFEGYIPDIELDNLKDGLVRLSQTTSSVDYSFSVWDNTTTPEVMSQKYTVEEYVSFLRSSRIVCLHANVETICAGYSFFFKLIFWPNAELNIIVYRQNLLPKDETQNRFLAVCSYFKSLYELFGGKALFLGPDTLDYPNWPDLSPGTWQRHWQRLI
jgi:hypothetical protein